eukprot:TRINITY_DN93887_c0_g1_i1.p1 TRINITY_DN93887_c0_g1~~TRINITY_DN93887_c0_g1_i1.p1  ORF type:complete len:204 (+),score=18.96 TRINITY_DN93887_c0_g1_i1:41-652(+)
MPLADSVSSSLLEPLHLNMYYLAFLAVVGLAAYLLQRWYKPAGKDCEAALSAGWLRVKPWEAAKAPRFHRKFTSLVDYSLSPVLLRSQFLHPTSSPAAVQRRTSEGGSVEETSMTSLARKMTDAIISGATSSQRETHGSYQMWRIDGSNNWNTMVQKVQEIADGIPVIADGTIVFDVYVMIGGSGNPVQQFSVVKGGKVLNLV